MAKTTAFIFALVSASGLVQGENLLNARDLRGSYASWDDQVDVENAIECHLTCPEGTTIDWDACICWDDDLYVERVGDNDHFDPNDPDGQHLVGKLCFGICESGTYWDYDKCACTSGTFDKNDVRAAEGGDGQVYDDQGRK